MSPDTPTAGIIIGCVSAEVTQTGVNRALGGSDRGHSVDEPPSPGACGTPRVRPIVDESYLILPRDKYLVSFRDEHDHWSDLIPLGDVLNTMRSGGCPSLSSDGKYFFFTSYPQVKWNKFFEKRHTYKDLQDITLRQPAPERTDIFWVEAKAIEKSKPKEGKSKGRTA